jgi:hypothetical protein
MYQNKVFFKIIFDISISKQFENIKKNFILRKKIKIFGNAVCTAFSNTPRLLTGSIQGLLSGLKLIVELRGTS